MFPDPATQLHPRYLLLQRNALCIVREPHLEGLQFGIQLLREIHVACGVADLIEIPVEWEHITEVVRAGRHSKFRAPTRRLALPSSQILR